MRASTTEQELADADFYRAWEEAFSNKPRAPRPDQDIRRAHRGERHLAREEDHPDAVLAGVRFSERRSGYPNNRITFD